LLRARSARRVPLDDGPYAESFRTDDPRRTPARKPAGGFQLPDRPECDDAGVDHDRSATVDVGRLSNELGALSHGHLLALPPAAEHRVPALRRSDREPRERD